MLTSLKDFHRCKKMIVLARNFHATKGLVLSDCDRFDLKLQVDY